MKYIKKVTAARKHKDDLDEVNQMIADNIIQVLEGKGSYRLNDELARLDVSNTKELWKHLKQGIKDIFDFTSDSDNLDLDIVEERLLDSLRDVRKSKKASADLIIKVEDEWNRLRKL